GHSARDLASGIAREVLARQKRIDVALALQELRVLAHIAQLDDELARQFALYRQRQVIGHWNFEYLILRGQAEGEAQRIGKRGNHATRRIRDAVFNTGLNLQGRIAAQQRRVIEQQAAMENGKARTD